MTPEAEEARRRSREAYDAKYRPYFCECPDEWCWCTRRVASAMVACAECNMGSHISEEAGLAIDAHRTGEGGPRRAVELVRRVTRRPAADD